MTILAVVFALFLASLGPSALAQSPSKTSASGTYPNITGVWKASKLGVIEGKDSWNLAKLDTLYKSGARSKLTSKDDGTLSCLAQGYPRALTFGRPIQIVQSKGLMIVMTEAYPAVRIIPQDGRPHLAARFRYPTVMGDSSGRWMGDTFVVDVNSFISGNWLASGQDKPNSNSPGVWPTSDALHITERWRRVDADTLEYQAHVEDPKMLTSAWDTPTVTLKRQSQPKIEEALCVMHRDPANYLARLEKEASK